MADIEAIRAQHAKYCPNGAKDPCAIVALCDEIEQLRATVVSGIAVDKVSSTRYSSTINSEEAHETMKTYGYSHGTAIVSTFSLSCNRCESHIVNEFGSSNLTIEDFELESTGAYRRGCGYCGARVSIPAPLVRFLG